MHSKRKGNIGQSAIVLELHKLGYSVFSELGDISKIDIIAEKDGKLTRIQCKAITPYKGKIEVSCKKSGPNYQFVYDLNELDVFAIYDLENCQCYWIPVALLQNKKTFALRLTAPKNNQKHGINLAADFELKKTLT